MTAIARMIASITIRAVVVAFDSEIALMTCSRGKGKRDEEQDTRSANKRSLLLLSPPLSLVLSVTHYQCNGNRHNKESS